MSQNTLVHVSGPAGFAGLLVFGTLMIIVTSAAGLDWLPALGVAAAMSIIAFLAVRVVELTREAGEAPAASRLAASGGGRQLSIKAIVGVLEIPAMAVDIAGRVICYNSHMRELFPKLEIGWPLFQVSRNPDLHQAFERARKQLVPQAGEMSDRTASGSRRIQLAIAPLAAPLPGAPETGSVEEPAFLIQMSDVSEQDRLDQLRSDFIANASHELRTPLASLKGFIETLQGPASNDTDARTRFLAIMEAQAARMARILDDLLSLSRIEMRAHLLPDGDVDVCEIVDAAVQGLEPLAQDAKITLSMSEITDPVPVRGDRDELEQVFQNLIHNAIKYGRPGGKVEVEIGRLPPRLRAPERVFVAVTDDGPGIPEEHLPRLTERFYRVDTATSREKGGTGLGLAIVKHILNRHRGELEIKSDVGKGSTFTVLLEASAPQAQFTVGRTAEDRIGALQNLIHDIND